jgi:hypothetical protein
MCGRYRLARKKEILGEFFDVENEVDWSPRYNIAPGQDVAFGVISSGLSLFSSFSRSSPKARLLVFLHCNSQAVFEGYEVTPAADVVGNVRAIMKPNESLAIAMNMTAARPIVTKCYESGLRKVRTP